MSSKGESMNSILNRSRSTQKQGWLLLPRLVAGVPLAGLGMMHLLKPEAFKAMIQAAGMPQASLIAAPLLEILAGILILSGFFSRIGGILALASMAGALYAHFVINPDLLPATVEMPPIMLPIVVVLAGLVIVALGGGRWSLDEKFNRISSNA